MDFVIAILILAQLAVDVLVVMALCDWCVRTWRERAEQRLQRRYRRLADRELLIAKRKMELLTWVAARLS